MKINRSASSLAAVVVLALAGVGLAGVAQAGDVYWTVGVSSGPPMVVVQPVYQPVYQQVYRAPQPVYVPRPVVYVQPVPVFVAPPQYIQADWGYPGQDRGWRHGHGRHKYERFEGERSEHGHGDHDRD